MEQYFNNLRTEDVIKKYNISDVYVVIGDLHAYDNEYILHQLSSQLGDQ